jgi:radical SAM superfamily enzyme YgiQ (UPF0313 family)
MEPLGIAMLSGLTPAAIRRTFFDDRVEPIDYAAPTDLVAITVETYTARRAYQIADRYRRAGVRVVLGGFHVSLCPEEAAGHADAIVVGEAERVWATLLDDAARNDLRARYAGDRPSLAGLRPDRGIFGARKYGMVSLVETSRGCNFGCEFCSISPFFHRRCLARPIAEVVAEVGALRKPVFFVDDNLGAEPARLRALCEGLLPLQCRWIGQASLHIADDPELLDLMRRSGCAGVLIGFESLDPGTLSAMGKGVNLGARDYAGAIERFRRHGLSIYATFVFGYDQDTPETFERVYRFALEQRFFFTAFNHLVPFPGTPVYQRLAAEGRLTSPQWWLDAHGGFGQVVYRPARMTANELGELCARYRRRFYSIGSVARRATDWRANCRTPLKAMIFLGQNLLHQREVVRRQGLPFGFPEDSS